MDDIYFSDKNKKNPTNPKKPKRYSPDEFKHTDYIDEDFTQWGKKENAFSQKERFTVNLPDEDYISESPADRTPKGRPLSHTGEASSDEITRIPAVRKAPSAPSPRPANTSGRSPTGQRVSPTPGQRPVRIKREGVAPQGAHHTPSPPKKNGSKGKYIILSVLALLFVFITALAGYGLSALQGLNYDDGIVPNAYVKESALSSSDEVINILFLGSDARGDVEGQRSDTMMLFSIDKKNKKLKLTSFLRDSYVYIPSKKYSTKLNAAFSYGGTQLVMDTIEYNFGVKLDHYVMVDFDAFRQLVDLLGGITVKGVTEAEAEYMREEVKLKKVKKGTNKMNGKTALWYCRIRYVDNDFKRTERQRKVISAIVSKALKTNPFKLVSIVKQVLPNISTDISTGELVALAAGAATKYIHYDILQQQIPAQGTWSDARISGQLVLKMDIEENKEILKDFLYGTDKKKDK